MKKAICFVVCCIAVLAVTSCGNKTVKGADGTEYVSYQDACRNNDFVAAYRIIELNDGEEEDKDYVFNAEMLYLVSQNTQEASNRVLYLLAEYSIPGIPPVIGREYHGDSSEHETREKVLEHIDGISRFNARCNSVLDLSISVGNENLASNVIKLFKKNFDLEYKQQLIGQDIIKIVGNNETDKEKAITKLEKAIKDGAFKNKSEDDSVN